MIALSEVNGDADADAGKVKTAAAELVQTEKQASRHEEDYHCVFSRMFSPAGLER
jgi:hypothetical protein